MSWTFNGQGIFAPLAASGCCGWHSGGLDALFMFLDLEKIRKGNKGCDDDFTRLYSDIVGIDNYTGRGDSIAASARLAVEIAEPRGKIAALTEVGPGSGLPRDRATHFFTKHLLEPLKNDRVAGRIAYALVWRNSSSGHFWIPPPSLPDADDLRKFRQDSWTVFEDDLPDVFKMRRAVGR